MESELADVKFDVAVIGAGIAGASIAAELSNHCRVIVLEAESQPGYHTTGRSAAIFAETYGPAPIRALTRASASFFHNPPPEFGATPLLSNRGVLMLARADQLDLLDALIADVLPNGPVSRLDKKGVYEIAPLLKDEYATAGMFDRHAMDIDVHALHLGYLHKLKINAGTLATNAQVEMLSRNGDNWTIGTTAGEFSASIVVNASGAWADTIGKLAGATTINLIPKRRTALIVATPDARLSDTMPLVADVEEQFYLKPEVGRLLISPADEVPSPPCDAQPEELEVAVCIDRIESAFDLKVGRIENKWAGLRNFVVDKCPVVGFDNQVPGFFWLAGQGGYGIQSAPALSRLSAALVLRRSVPSDILDQGLNLGDIYPARLGPT